MEVTLRHALAASVALTALSLLVAEHAEAAPITYTETTIAGGTLGSQIFTNSQVTISFIGDTAGVINPAPGFVTNVAGVASVVIAGLGAATFNGGGQASFDFQARLGQ